MSRGDGVPARRRRLVQPHPVSGPGARRVARRRRGSAARRAQSLLQLETVPAGQWSSLVLRTAVGLALWRGDLADAPDGRRPGLAAGARNGRSGADRRRPRRPCSRRVRRPPIRDVSGATGRPWQTRARSASEVLPLAEQNLARHRLPPSVGARREAELYLATARAHRRARPRAGQARDVGRRLPRPGRASRCPTRSAKARWWQAQAALPVRARRAEARRALLEAWRIASELPAAPLQAALRDLAHRGRINLPGELVAITIEPEQRPRRGRSWCGRDERSAGGPRRRSRPAGALAASALARASTACCSCLPRAGPTARSPSGCSSASGPSPSTSRRILAKLGVSGRVEAAGVAIRLGLLPDDPRVSTPAGMTPPPGADSAPNRTIGKNEVMHIPSLIRRLALPSAALLLVSCAGGASAGWTYAPLGPTPSAAASAAAPSTAATPAPGSPGGSGGGATTIDVKTTPDNRSHSSPTRSACPRRRRGHRQLPQQHDAAAQHPLLRRSGPERAIAQRHEGSYRTGRHGDASPSPRPRSRATTSSGATSTTTAMTGIYTSSRSSQADSSTRLED